MSNKSSDISHRPRMEEFKEAAASISVLPEVCISDILSLTSPRDASRAAAISKTFNTAADSDVVWEKFLPPDYRQVIARAVSPVFFETKKELYMYLSDSHVLLDRGTLDKDDDDV
ncbi:F-box domain, cyclin-like protein [Artemisia annua]|uniref:F-box domain, cyclin-like protein n=1 Tax=Artemisia annua TaxID=35608 RepID=A0A2U1NDR4_ARTAN|nr:F-box domain, cyclin-like protein [Artemisia annua]